MNTRWIAIMTVWVAVVPLAGCMQDTALKKEVPREASPLPPPAIESEKSPGPDPRIQASLKLTEQGRHFLDAQQPDKAIRLFEQAVSLNPVNGINYYYLAEAWLIKGRLDEAREFNRLAETYLNEDPQWMLRVGRQAQRIVEKEK